MPTLQAAALDVRADDDELSWLLSLDPTVVAVLAGAGAVLLLIAVLAGWLLLRRVRRSPLVARARELGAQGATAVAARRLPAGSRRTAAELQLELARARGRLRERVATASAAGAHLGEIPALLPSLEGEGVRLERLLRQQAVAPAGTDGARLETEARAFLDMVAEVCEAVQDAERAAAAAGRVDTEVADAVAALRAHTSAYRELTTPPAPPRLPDRGTRG
ncbi:hypothetical protein [Blastococcus sp. SYSU D00820]